MALGGVGAFPSSLRAQHFDWLGFLLSAVVAQVDGGEENAFGRVAHLGPEDAERIAPHQHRRVAHGRVEEQRALFETAQGFRHAVELAGHDQRVGLAALVEDAHVGSTENLAAHSNAMSLRDTGAHVTCRPALSRPW